MSEAQAGASVFALSFLPVNGRRRANLNREEGAVLSPADRLEIEPREPVAVRMTLVGKWVPATS